MPGRKECKEKMYELKVSILHLNKP